MGKNRKKRERVYSCLPQGLTTLYVIELLDVTKALHIYNCKTRAEEEPYTWRKQGNRALFLKR